MFKLANLATLNYSVHCSVSDQGAVWFLPNLSLLALAAVLILSTRCSNCSKEINGVVSELAYDFSASKKVSKSICNPTRGNDESLTMVEPKKTKYVSYFTNLYYGKDFVEKLQHLYCYCNCNILNWTFFNFTDFFYSFIFVSCIICKIYTWYLCKNV